MTREINVSDNNESPSQALEIIITELDPKQAMIETEKAIRALKGEPFPSDSPTPKLYDGFLTGIGWIIISDVRFNTIQSPFTRKPQKMNIARFLVRVWNKDTHTFGEPTEAEVNNSYLVNQMRRMPRGTLLGYPIRTLRRNTHFTHLGGEHPRMLYPYDPTIDEPEFVVDGDEYAEGEMDHVATNYAAAEDLATQVRNAQRRVDSPNTAVRSRIDEMEEARDRGELNRWNENSREWDTPPRRTRRAPTRP